MSRDPTWSSSPATANSPTARSATGTDSRSPTSWPTTRRPSAYATTRCARSHPRAVTQPRTSERARSGAPCRGARRERPDPGGPARHVDVLRQTCEVNLLPNIIICYAIALYRPRMSHEASPSTLTGPTRTETSTRRAVLNTLKGSAGNLVEWYDVYVYTVFATYFEAQFFDKDDANSTLYIYAIFAVTFIMRPVGAWFFGRFADRRGRKAALMLSITVMSSCSFLVAIMPTRETIGYWAAVILILARLVQGFATGGEYGTSATYMSEAATVHRRGFLSSFQYVTLIGGHVLAQVTLLIALSVLGDEVLSDWGWRIGFFIGGIAALVVLWIRRSMDESLSESHLKAIHDGKDQNAGSMKALFTTHWRSLLLVFLITAGGTVAFYTYSINAPAIVKSTFGTDRALTATWINLLGLIFLMLLQPVGGIISDLSLIHI